MGNLLNNKHICEAERPIIDKSQETTQAIWNQMEIDNVFEVIIGHTLSNAQRQFPQYNFRSVSLDGYSFPMIQNYDVRRINVNLITVDGAQIIDSIVSVG